MTFEHNRVLAGEAILFIGAGASYKCQDLSGNSIGFLGSDLIDKICLEFLGSKKNNVNLDFVANLAIQKAGRLNFDNFIKDLVNDFEPTDEHRKIPNFPWKAIVTTNYDEVIEKTYQERRKDKGIQRLEKILSDNDSVSKILLKENALPYIKIHGCISRLNDPSLPLIISTRDYRYFNKNRSSLFATLKEFFTNNLVIFYGYSLSDDNIMGLLDDLEEENKSRPRHIWLDPYANDWSIDFWRSKNIDYQSKSLSQFLDEIESEPRELKNLGILIKNESKISTLISSHNKPSDGLEKYLTEELIYIDVQEESQLNFDKYNNEIFYTGNPLNFNWVAKNLDFERTVTNQIIEEIYLDSEISNKLFNFYLIDGYAGSGKTVLLKRLFWIGCRTHNKPCFYLLEGSNLNSDYIIELINLIDQPIYLFIDNILDYQNTIKEIFDYCNRNLKKVFCLGVARTNEWNNSSNILDNLNPLMFNLRDLDDKEINALIVKLKEFNVEGNLKEFNDKEKFSIIKGINKNQLLITLLEATFLGKEFDEIIKDEYDGIYDRVAKDLYLNICTLHQFGVETRAGMINRLSGIDFNSFRDRFLQPLELLVVSYRSRKIGDIVYASRHEDIAKSVYSQAFDSQFEKAQSLIKILRFLNVSYETDKIALEAILKGKDLAEQFTDKDLVYQIYNIAKDIGINNSFLLHQQAIFEINHAEGNLDYALDLIKKIATNDSFYDIKIVNHTRANIYKKIASRENNLETKKYYWNLGLKLVEKNLATSKNSMNHLTKGQILLDEMRDATSDNEDMLSVIRDFEANLASGYRKFPDDNALITLEFDYKKFLEDTPTAIIKLDKALVKNSDNIYLLQRYAKYHIEKKDFDTARSALNNYLKNNPKSHEINYLMAYSYMKENEQENIENILKYLSKSYSANDNSYLNKFEHARFLFIYGNEDKAYRIFNELEKAGVSANIKNSIRSGVFDSNSKDKIFDGTVFSINGGYGFVKCNSFKENIFFNDFSLKNKEDWEFLNKGDRVNFTLTFTFRGPRVKNLNIF